MVDMRLDPNTGLIEGVPFVASPNCDDRENFDQPLAIILHSISLPPGEYGGDQVERFFTNRLAASEHPYFEQLEGVTVSAHFFIKRDGSLIQFVPTNKRAWHAGESVCLNMPKVNDFSIGIEIEGWDEASDGYSSPQYECLNSLIRELKTAYPSIANDAVFAHSDIAPERKQDPGPYFDWSQIKSVL